MSGKSAKKIKFTQPPKPPRPMEEIQKEYGQLCSQVGQTQYQVYALAAEVERLNERLLELNQEGAARKAMDDAKAKEETDAKS